MKITRLFAALSACALAIAGAPAFAEDQPLPAACGGTAPLIAEDEMLVEHTLYLHGTSQLGDHDAAEDLLAGSPRMTYMDATAPTGPASKVDTNLASAGNDQFNGNPMLSYWATQLDAPVRIVCASATVFTTDGGNPTLQLFFDQPYAAATPGATVTATGTGTGVREVTGVFKPFDVINEYDLTLQVIASRPGMHMLYDSTTHPSSFTYVTVEQAPVVEPTEPTEAP